MISLRSAERISLDGADDKVSLPVYIKVPSTPVFDSISFERLLDCRGQLSNLLPSYDDFNDKN